MSDDVLGSREDNEKASYKLVTDASEQKVAQRVDDPAGNVLLQDIADKLIPPVIVDFPLEHHDSFENIIVVNPITIFESNVRLSKRVNYWDESLTGGATSTHDANLGEVVLTVGTASGDKVIRQTYQRFHYTKGNAQQIIFTSRFGTGAAGVRKRVGQFDIYNGLFFEQNGTDFRVVIRSSVSGSAVDTVVSQADWNLDKLDGTGESGFNLDADKHIIFFINYAWLGSGTVFFGVYNGGEKITCHKFQFSNIIETFYSQSAELPLRYEIENLLANASSHSLIQGCASVKTLGETPRLGQVKIIDSGTTTISVSATDKVCAGIRLAPSAVKGAAIKTVGFSIHPVSGNSVLYYQILLRSTLTGATWAAFSDVTETLSNTPTHAGGILIASGYLTLSNALGTQVSLRVSQLENDKWLGYSINETPDSLILVARTTSGTGSILFSGTFEELT